MLEPVGHLGYRRLMNDAGAKDQGLGAKLLKELENGLLIAYRVKNHALDYSIMNRPEPNLSGVDDHALATAIVYAGNKFRIVHSPTLASRPEKVSRSDGRTITYDELIDIDFDEGVIRTSRRETMTLQMLQGIVGDLMSKATKPSPGVMTEKPRSAN